jgi:hypothetical protein
VRRENQRKIRAAFRGALLTKRRHLVALGIIALFTAAGIDVEAIAAAPLRPSPLLNVFAIADIDQPELHQDHAQTLAASGGQDSASGRAARAYQTTTCRRESRNVTPAACAFAPSAEATWVTRGWAGYVVRAAGTPFSQITADWTVPRVVCNRPGSSVAVWIGLGGSTSRSRTLEQVGTSVDCSERALVSHSAWYQLFPAPPVELPIALAPGDRLHATVAVADWDVSVTFTNVTTGANVSTKTWMRFPETDSAEWIVEAPSACFTTCSPLPLADFRRVTFTNASTSVKTHTGTIDDPRWSRLRLEMAPRPGRSIAAATRLSGGGSSFGVVRLRAVPST